MSRLSSYPLVAALTVADASIPVVRAAAPGGIERVPVAQIAPWSTINPLMGPLVDKGGSILFRVVDRLLAGAAAAIPGTSTAGAGSTFVSDAFNLNCQWIERSATIYGVSPWGGIGVAGASRSSDQYTYFGYGVWTTGESVSIGARRGYRQNLYVAATAGVAGITPPTHTGGTVSDGTVDWTFVDHTYQTQIGLVGIVLQDVLDGNAAWGAYLHAHRAPGAGTAFAIEADSKNMGSDVVPDSYNWLPVGSTPVAHFAAGGDPLIAPPTNPSSHGINFANNGTTFNVGINFAYNSLTPDGFGFMTAISLPQKAMLKWWVSAGLMGANMRSEVSDPARPVQFIYVNDGFEFITRSALSFLVENHAGGDPVNYLRADGVATGSGPALNALGSDTDIDLPLVPKGAGLVRFGVATAKAAEAFNEVLLIKTAAGVTKKVMLCA